MAGLVERIGMLSDRRQRVLAALIEEYVAYALPVGSRTLTERYRLGVSSATVRNELSVLEDEGYIAQPHTSAGRIPTDTGYRAFVDELLEGELADESADEQLVEQIRNSAQELDDLVEETSAALTRLTDCLSVVLPPSVMSLHIRQITLVSLSPRRTLLVVVTEDGQVLNRTVEFSEDVDTQDLARVQTLFNEVFAGKSLVEIKDSLRPETAQELSDPLAQALLGEFFACVKEGDADRAHSLGVSALLSKPEFASPQRFLPMLQMLEDETVLLHVLTDVDYQGGTVVKIGSENRSQALSGVSVVAAQYGAGPAAGIVAVIGPTRMDYSNVIKAVRAARSMLDGK